MKEKYRYIYIKIDGYYFFKDIETNENYCVDKKIVKLLIIIDKFISTGKPFIVENVRNYPMFKRLGLYDKNCYIYKHGRHTYWTNVMFDMSTIPQEYDFKTIPGYGQTRLKSYVQGGKNVNDVLDWFIIYVLNNVL